MITDKTALHAIEESLRILNGLESDLAERELVVSNIWGDYEREAVQKQIERDRDDIARKRARLRVIRQRIENEPGLEVRGA